MKKDSMFHIIIIVVTVFSYFARVALYRKSYDSGYINLGLMFFCGVIIIGALYNIFKRS